MNDRYLFKAKTVAHKGCENFGEWVVGCLIVNESANDMFKYRIQPIEDSQLFAPPIDPSTICQCTGLKDKNGTLIWENDVVLCKQYIGGNQIDYHVELGYVDMKHGAFGLHRKKGYCRPFKNWLEDYEYEVIGSIFDNPELLEVE